MSERPQRLRAELKVVVEYDAWPSDYQTDDPDEMANVDLRQWSAEPHLLMASFDFEDGDPNETFELTVRPA